MNYINDLYTFLDQLSQNNNREWFAANKHRYEHLRSLWLDDLDRLIAAMTQWQPDLAGQTAKRSAYRIYRDTRFSLDKTPYKTHFSASITPYDRKSEHAGYYLEIGLDSPTDFNQGLYGGIWMISSPSLRKMRHAIVDNIEEWLSIVQSPQMAKYGWQWCGPTLKTMPKGWDKNHPQAFFLKMQNYGKFAPLDRRFFSRNDWPQLAADMFHTLKPMVDFINYSLDE